MSLKNILDMRLSGKKPGGVVAVVIGDIPKAYKADPLVLQVKPNDLPAFTDWRPLVGCWVAVYNKTDSLDLMDKVMFSLFDAGVKMFGFVNEGIAYPLTLPSAEYDKKVKFNLQSQWEQLCRS